MWWRQPGFLAFDTETTGTDPAHDRIITAAVVQFIDGVPAESTSWLITVDVPIPAESTAVHGITDAMSQADGIPQHEALTQIREVLTRPGLPVVAFNADFDIQMLNANLARCGLEPLGEVQVVCPMVLDKQFNKYVRGRNQRRLSPTAARYGIDMDEDAWHGAEADATITGRILLAQMDAYPELATIPHNELGAHVTQWRAQQEADFQAWLASRNT